MDSAWEKHKVGSSFLVLMYFVYLHKASFLVREVSFWLDQCYFFGGDRGNTECGYYMGKSENFECLGPRRCPVSYTGLSTRIACNVISTVFSGKNVNACFMMQ